MKKAKPKITPKIALDHLMAICSRSEKSPHEIETKLKEWGLEEQATSIIETLKKENFLNTSRFANAFARDKAQFNKWGKIKIRYYLKGHQIEANLIETALEKINMDNYAGMFEAEMDKKLKSLKIKDTYQIKAKLYAFGNQRGYEPELMNRYFDAKGF